MSKERLEEIKEDVFKCNHGSTRGYSYEQLYHIALSLVRIHGEWLIEQAERTQELEEFNRILSSDKSMFIEELVREQQQNKRYREVIEYVMTAKSTHYSSLENALEDIKYVINEVLERDSE